MSSPRSKCRDSETHKYGVIDPGRDRRPADRDPRHGRKARAGDRAVEPDAARPLHPPARGDARARRAGNGRRRRNPADRRDGQADRQAAVPRLPVRGRALRLRQRGGLRDRQSRDGAGARRHRGRAMSASYSSTRSLKAPARRPSRDSRASSRAGSWAGTRGHAPAAASWSGGSARA